MALGACGGLADVNLDAHGRGELLGGSYQTRGRLFLSWPRTRPITQICKYAVTVSDRTIARAAGEAYLAQLDFFDELDEEPDAPEHVVKQQQG